MIIDYEYYAECHNECSQADFERMEKLAEKKIISVIGLVAWAQITEDTFGYDALMDCACDVVDILCRQESTGAGKGVTSVSNDGYTEHYAVTGADGANKEIRAAVINALSGTGLVKAY